MATKTAEAPKVTAIPKVVEVTAEKNVYEPAEYRPRDKGGRHWLGKSEKNRVPGVYIVRCSKVDEGGQFEMFTDFGKMAKGLKWDGPMTLEEAQARLTPHPVAAGE